MRFGSTWVNILIVLFFVSIPVMGRGQTIIWSDDFEDGVADGWSFWGDGNWTIVEDESYVLDQSNSGVFDTWAIADSCPVLSNYRLKAKVKVTGLSDTGTVQILGRCSDGDLHLGYACMSGSCGVYIYDNLQDRDTLLALSYDTLELDTWYYFEAYMYEDTVKFKAWEAALSEPEGYLLEAIVESWLPGRVGLRYSGGAGRYDNVEVIEIETTGVESTLEEHEMPKEVWLCQNYPNPFNPETHIEFFIPKAGIVDMKIYNALGQVVRNQVNEHKPVGKYSVGWDGRNDAGERVASGMYFYQLQVDDFVSSKKMLLLK